MEKNEMICAIMLGGFLYAHAVAFADYCIEKEGVESFRHNEDGTFSFDADGGVYILKKNPFKYIKADHCVMTFEKDGDIEICQDLKWLPIDGYDSDVDNAVKIIRNRRSWEPPKNPNHYAGHLAVI